MEELKHDHQECKKTIRAVHDAMDVLNGKWKISIVAALCFKKKRYSDLLRDVHGISGKMLSRELKDLELNQFVKRTVLCTHPVIVEYELTELGHSLKDVINSLALWGLDYREKIVGKEKSQEMEMPIH